jgi:hypothetical protein
VKNYLRGRSTVGDDGESGGGIDCLCTTEKNKKEREEEEEVDVGSSFQPVAPTRQV